MARMHKWLGLAFIGLSLTGCVSQEKYNAMKLSRDDLAQQLSTADADAQAAKAQVATLNAELANIGSSGSTRDAMVANLTQQLAELNGRYADVKRAYDDLLRQPPQVVTMGGSVLPPQLTNELQAFATANPDMVDFDAARGVVKFKSDVTFASGSADVNSNAKAVLEKFSTILNSPAAAGYELMVAGHTDNTPIVRKETIESGQFDNWYLSAHRAISVAAALVADGVSKKRLGVAGYADQRPIASNATEAGKAQNRRVEIIILPTPTRTTPLVNVPDNNPRAKQASGKQGALNKDTPAAEVRVPLNK
jgi:chemotaxis protein MotB